MVDGGSRARVHHCAASVDDSANAGAAVDFASTRSGGICGRATAAGDLTTGAATAAAGSRRVGGRAAAAARVDDRCTAVVPMWLSAPGMDGRGPTPGAPDVSCGCV